MTITHIEHEEGRPEITIIAADENKNETFLTIPYKPGLPKLIRRGDGLFLSGRKSCRWKQRNDGGACAEFEICHIEHPEEVFPGPLGL